MRSRNETVAALRRQEDELAAALRRLEEQDRLVSLGLLSASVAHELNTPLAVLNGSIEKLIENATRRSCGRTNSNDWNGCSASRSVCRRSARAWSDFRRMRKQHMEPLAVRPLIDEAWGLVAIDEKSSAVEFVNHVRAEDRVIGNRGSPGAGVRESAAQRAESRSKDRRGRSKFARSGRIVAASRGW